MKKYFVDFKEAGTRVQEGIANFHNCLVCLMLFITVVVLLLVVVFGGGLRILNFIFLYFSLFNRLGSYVGFKGFCEFISILNVFVRVKEREKRELLEIVWTIVRGIILSFVSVPSIALLYAMEETTERVITVTVVGRQWSWLYEYSIKDEGLIEFESYMVGEEDLELGEFRLLEVDNRLVLPVRTHVRLLLTSTDVLHSIAVPSIGIKVDCCPGRLNEVSLFVKREGVYYGQCSELCGMLHAIMRVGVEVVSMDSIKMWVLGLEEDL